MIRIHVVLIGLAVSSALNLPAQTPASLGCTESKGYYHCNDVAFLAYLKNANTVTVESKPFDRGTMKSLSDLARAMNKTEAPQAAEQPADLTIVLEKTPEEGMFYGPGGRELASLYVYSKSRQGTLGQLIWVEEFFGQPDMPWPTVVYNIIRQFKDSIK
jgi:hypothetical protein